MTAVYTNTDQVKAEGPGLPSLGAMYALILRHEATLVRKVGQRRSRNFRIRFDQPGANQSTEVSGSILSRTAAQGVGVTFAPELLADPEFRSALTELIDQTSTSFRLWPNIESALAAVEDRG